jgi:hypothetical protein
MKPGALLLLLPHIAWAFRRSGPTSQFKKYSLVSKVCATKRNNRAIVPSESPIDPLEEVKVTADFGKKPSAKRKATKKPDAEYSLVSSKTAEQQSLSEASSANDGLTAEQRILLEEAKILRTLPLELFYGFRSFAEQLIPRFALITLTFHVMLLIPVLQYLKFSMGMSIGPYLYIGPALFLVPYITFWLWENDVTKVPVLDEQLRKYIRAQKTLADDGLPKETENLMRIVEANVQPESTQRLAYLRLIASVDIDIIYDEVNAVKSRVAASNKSSTGASDDANAKSARSLSTLTTFDPDKSDADGASLGLSNGPRQTGSVLQAAQEVIKSSLAQGKDRKTLLEELKQLQKDLEK